MARSKRTLRRYRELFFDTTSLFGKPVSVTIFPNGDNEIWIQGSGNKGFRITASEGPAGLGLRISHFVGGREITIAGNEHRTYEPIRGLPDAFEVTLTQYNTDEYSQRFKDWYQERGEHPEKLGLQRLTGVVERSEDIDNNEPGDLSPEDQRLADGLKGDAP